MTTHTASINLTIAELGTILSVWAHPDDETYLAGGVMAAARDNGQRVVCASATAGEHGTPDPETWPPERLGRLRRWESAAAMTVLGVDDHRFIGLPDGELDRHDRRGRTLIGRLLDDVQPDTILTFGGDGITFHPDHVAVHHWVTKAWELRGHRGRLLYARPTTDHLARFGQLYEQWGVYMSDERPTGAHPHELAVHLTLDRPHLDRKIAALAAMASQTGAAMSTLDLQTYAASVAEESFVDARTITGM
jgi:LmbE family N-acetylglucosaminyl deacetylase